MTIWLVTTNNTRREKNEITFETSQCALHHATMPISRAITHDTREPSRGRVRNFEFRRVAVRVGVPASPCSHDHRRVSCFFFFLLPLFSFRPSNHVLLQGRSKAFKGFLHNVKSSEKPHRSLLRALAATFNLQRILIPQRGTYRRA